MSKRVAAVPETQWMPVLGYPGYEVSRTGEVRSFRTSRGFTGTPKILSRISDKNGYQRLTLCRNGEKKRRGIHQLVAESFLHAARFEGAVVRHLNGNPSDNRVENLKWGTPSENSRDMVRHKRAMNMRPDEEIAEIRRLYDMGFKQREIARVFKASQAYIHEVISRKRRDDVE